MAALLLLVGFVSGYTDSFTDLDDSGYTYYKDAKVYDVVIDAKSNEYTGNSLNIKGRIIGDDGGSLLAYYNTAENTSYFAFTFVYFSYTTTPTAGDMKLLIRPFSYNKTVTGETFYYPDGYSMGMDGVLDFPSNNTRVEVLIIDDIAYIFYDGTYQDEFSTGGYECSYFGVGFYYGHASAYNAVGEMYIDDLAIGDDWYDADYQYRVPFVLYNSKTSSLTDYPVLFTINRDVGYGNVTGSGTTVYMDSTYCQEDYDDIRFTNVNGEIVYDVWVENYDSDVAEIWSEFDYITPGYTLYYMYFGNSSKTSISDGDATFTFFDDFDDASLDLSKWTVHDLTYSEYGGYLNLTGEDVEGQYINSDQSFGMSYAIKSRTLFTNTDTFWNIRDYFGFYWDNYAPAPYGYNMLVTNKPGKAAHVCGEGGTTYFSGTISTDDYYEYSILRYYSSGVLDHCKIFLDTVELLDTTHAVTYSDMAIAFVQYNGGETYTQSHDWILVRKYDYQYEPSVYDWGDVEGSVSEEGVPPTSAFYSNRTYGYPNFTVAFYDSSTNTPTSWYWEFGDGDTSTDQHPVHAYDTVIGNSIYQYTVSMQATNDDGSDWENKSAYMTLYPISADFLPNVSAGYPELPVSFTDYSLGGATNWSWDFGGLATSFDQNPIYTFTEAGTHNVTLNASNDYSWDIYYENVEVYSYDCVNWWYDTTLSSGDTAVIYYYVNTSVWNTTENWYFLNITNPSDEVIQSWEITSRADEALYKSVLVSSPNGFDTSGSYNSTFVYVNKSTFATTEMSYDVASVTTTEMAHEGTAIAGIVVDSITSSYVSGATVYISNSTWSDTNVTSATGWYLFDNLDPESDYDFVTVKNGYLSNTTEITTDELNSIVYESIYIIPVYALNLDIFDLDTQERMYNSISITITEGIVTTNSTTTTSGTANFSMEYGSYSLLLTTDGYEDYSATFTLSSNLTTSVYMTPIPDYGSTMDYPIAPRVVRFVCQDSFGVRLSGVGVTADGYSTTMPDWGLFSVIFGWSAAYTSSSFSNDTMSGSTGDDGAVTFMMSDALQYEMVFTDATRGISDTLYITPKEDTYLITLGAKPFEAEHEWVNMTVYAVEPNSSYTTLYGYYNDPNLHTTSTNFTVRNSSGTVIYYNVRTGENLFTETYDVSHVTGDQYTWGIAAVQTDYGTLTQYSSITLHSRLIELGIEDVYYTWISIIFLFLLLPMFSGRNTIYGYVVIPIIAGMFYWFGWFPITELLITGVIILGIVLFMSKRKAQGEGT